MIEFNFHQLYLYTTVAVVPAQPLGLSRLFEALKITTRFFRFDRENIWSRPTRLRVCVRLYKQ